MTPRTWRPISTRGVAYFYAVRGITLLMLIGVAIVIDYLSGLPRFVYSPAFMFAGIGIIAATKLVEFKSIRAFREVGQGSFLWVDAPRKLVDLGPYAYVRNPLYLTLFVDTVALSLIFGSPTFLLVLAGVSSAIHVLVVGREEPRLAKKFGAAYYEYRHNVPRWIPRLRPKTLPSSD